MKERRKKQLSGKDLAQAIETACERLMYVSETDAPIELLFVIKKKGVTASEAVLNSFEVKEAIVEEPAADFFEKLTTEGEWHGPREKARVKRFAKLRDLLEENLTEVALFRSGRIRVEIVVAGKDADGNVAGIKTKAVET